MKEIDLEDLANHTAEVLKREIPKPSAEDVIRYENIVRDILRLENKMTDKDFQKLKKQYKFECKKSFLFQVFLEMKKKGKFDDTDEFNINKHLQIKPCKSWSGIVTITVFTAAFPEYTDHNGQKITQPFSCQFDCAFCPKQPNMPRSYIDAEPGVLRATRNKFDAVSQMWDRMNALYVTGHLPSKIEIIVSGGTWTSYPKEYRLEFCRDLYFAANEFWNEQRRTERFDIEREKDINQMAKSRIIGITIETRPDTINIPELKLLRLYGVTRVQLGIQHIDDDILRKVKRRCTTSKAIKAIELLKSNGFKIDAHWMPNLPGSTIQKDRHMLLDVLLGLNTPIKSEVVYKKKSLFSWISGKSAEILEYWEYYDIACPELSVDYWKLYPTAVTPWTEIAEWFKNGTYTQYDESLMFDMFLDVHKKMYPFIRLNRIIRDIPETHIYNQGTGSDNTNMRHDLNTYMMDHHIYSMDIRNREVKDREWDGNYIMVIRQYNASNGKEYFISAESQDKKILYGFVRLRLDGRKDKIKVFRELDGMCALIRELRCYGKLSSVGQNGQHVQHMGLGKTLMNRAEKLALDEGYEKIAVISGEGTKPYYNKLGYMNNKQKDGGDFMIKVLG